MTFSARPGLDWLAMTARHYGAWCDGGAMIGRTALAEYHLAVAPS